MRSSALTLYGSRLEKPSSAHVSAQLVVVFELVATCFFEIEADLKWISALRFKPHCCQFPAPAVDCRRFFFEITFSAPD